MKLPKQWRDWCAAMRLKPAYGRKAHDWWYLKGRGHMWRVNCYGMLQCGDTYDEFDRWALCHITEVERLPSSKAEFRETILKLLEEWNASRWCPDVGCERGLPGLQGGQVHGDAPQ